MMQSTQEPYQTEIGQRISEVYRRGDFMHTCKVTTGCVFGLALLVLTSSCGGSGSMGGGTGGAPVGPSLYVTQVLALFGPPLSSSIMQFSSDSNGSVSPASTVKGPTDVTFEGLAVDATGNLYVGGLLPSNNLASQGQLEILIYGPGSNGMAKPTRTITGTSTGLEGFTQNSISGLAVDSSANVYVSSGLIKGGLVNPGISVFPSTANGDVAPSNVITMTNIGTFTMGQIAVDSAGNIYVAATDPLAPGAILIFAANSTGTVPPTSTITGPETMLDGVEGVAVDSEGNVYASNISSTGAFSIFEFSAGSTGNVAPMRTISGSATTMNAIGNLTVDSAGNIYVLNDINILKFSPTATGNVAPTATISSMFFENFNIAVQ
jgi:hypothetical protein